MSGPSFAIVGFGELGSMLAEGLPDVRVWSSPRASLADEVDAAGAELCSTVGEAVGGASVVIATVPCGSAGETLASCLPHLATGTLYVDPAPLRPDLKAEAAERVADAGALYVDAAALGTAAADGFALPFLAAGAGAERWRALVAPLGMNVTVLDGPAGAASRLKLVRSVYMKGRDALMVEMLLAARAYGVEAELLQSIAGAGERVAFPDLAKRVVTALAVHAERRADELSASADVLREAGVDPIVTEAGEERLRRFAGAGLREHFAGRRPETIDEVLEALEAAVAAPTRG